MMQNIFFGHFVSNFITMTMTSSGLISSTLQTPSVMHLIIRRHTSPLRHAAGVQLRHLGSSTAARAPATAAGDATELRAALGGAAAVCGRVPVVGHGATTGAPVGGSEFMLILSSQTATHRSPPWRTPPAKTHTTEGNLLRAGKQFPSQSAALQTIPSYIPPLDSCFRAAALFFNDLSSAKIRSPRGSNWWEC